VSNNIKVGDQDSQPCKYFFICFGSTNQNDRESGPKAAEKAITEMNGREIEGYKLYVREALSKTDRETELKHETFKYKNSKKRCNLYVKGFPPNMNEADLRTHFSKFGDIESIKLYEAKEPNKSPFAFVCYKTPE
jgi:RNA recognition motif-containing protein